MKSLISWIRNYFGFRYSEARGVLVLFIVIFFGLILNLFIPSIFSIDSKVDSLEISHLDSLLIQIGPTTASSDFDFPTNLRTESKSEFERFLFDPNKIDSSQFVSLGFNPKVAGRIVKYRSKGGKFKKPEDIRKIWGVSEVFYQQIQSLISIESKGEDSPLYIERAPVAKSTNSRLDINQADSISLEKLKGIGGYTAAKIIKYRNALGGFVSKEQFFEIKGFDSVRVSTWIDQVEIADSVPFQRISINSATFEELSKHPYITGSQAKVIIAYREQHGPYLNADQLMNIKIVSSDWVIKISPYLKF